MSNPTRVTVTGAAGQIGYSLVFRIASGQMLGQDRPLELRLLEIPQAMGALEGVAMELVDCAFPLLEGIDLYDDAGRAFDGANLALLVGSRPRTKGMERSELLSENGKIFTSQGKALSEHAASDVRVLVVGNPANTNCLIAMSNAPDIPRERFTSMMRLDHNRAIARLAAKLAVPVSEVSKMGVWGNHSPTMYPNLFHAEVGGEQASARVDDQAWIESLFAHVKADWPHLDRIDDPGVLRAELERVRHEYNTAPPSSRRAARPARHRPPARPSITCTTGSREPRGDGSPWEFPRTAPTRSPRDSSAAFPARARTEIPRS